MTSDEAAFLEMLKANPADDVTRLVYADWLDDHNEHAKAEYLRRTCALVIEGANTDPASQVLELGEIVPVEWATAAASRFDVVVHACDSGEVISLIKSVKELNGASLGLMKWFYYNLPQAVFRWVPPDTALMSREYLLAAAPKTDVRITASELYPPPAPNSYHLAYDTLFRIQASASFYGTSHDNPATQQAANTAFANFLTRVMEVGDQTVPQDRTEFFVSSPLHPAAFMRSLLLLREVAKQYSGKEWTINVRAAPSS